MISIEESDVQRAANDVARCARWSVAVDVVGRSLPQSLVRSLRVVPADPAAEPSLEGPGGAVEEQVSHVLGLQAAPDLSMMAMLPLRPTAP